MQLYVELGMQLQAALEKATTSEEKSFIEDLKDRVATVKTFVEFGILMTTLATQHGINLERVKAIFGG